MLDINRLINLDELTQSASFSHATATCIELWRQVLLTDDADPAIGVLSAITNTINLSAFAGNELRQFLVELRNAAVHERKSQHVYACLVLHRYGVYDFSVFNALAVSVDWTKVEPHVGEEFYLVSARLGYGKQITAMSFCDGAAYAKRDREQMVRIREDVKIVVKSDSFSTHVFECQFAFCHLLRLEFEQFWEIVSYIDFDLLEVDFRFVFSRFKDDDFTINTLSSIIATRPPVVSDLFDLRNFIFVLLNQSSSPLIIKKKT
jgi:hypothetical protein